MEKTFAGVTEEYARENVQWVVKHDGWREVATGAELNARGKWWEDDTIRDIDLAAKQADPVMQRFVDKWEEINRTEGFVALPELFEDYAE